MTGPKFYQGEPIEGSWRSHQVPLQSPAQDEEQLELLKGKGWQIYTTKAVLRTPKEWLHGYKPHELFDQDGRPPTAIDKVLLPKEEKRMGRRKETYDAYRPLNLPDWKQFGQQKGTDVSETMVIGQYLAEVFKRYMQSR